ncbi:MAG: hypothetical protein RAO92_00240 [Candidatus Euphemobacter frigidus]|nr:hypothetical protein [Candidatus Euphemobacter frigidus]MDP8274807.1 hypothetical protein [Candidatus Euphemobacter frigidus]
MVTRSHELISKMVGEIVGSYESKVKVVIALMREVNRKLGEYHAEQERMIDNLRERFSRYQSLRRSDFDALMEGIRSHQEERENEVNRMVEDFCRNEEETVAKLKEILTVSSPSVVDDFNVLKEKVLRRPKERERRISRMLRDFHRDREELNIALRMLLEKGPAIRVKDIKAMVKAFTIERKDDNIEVERVLEEFEQVKDEISSQWQRVMATVNS